MPTKILRSIVVLIGFLALVCMLIAALFVAFLVLYNPCGYGGAVPGATFFFVIFTLFLIGVFIMGTVFLVKISKVGNSAKPTDNQTKNLQSATQTISKKENTKDPMDVMAIANYIYKARQKGKGENQIINSLQRAGWKADEIESAIRYLVHT